MTRSSLLLITLAMACNAPEPNPLSEDQDGDGFVGFDDCDDTRADIYPNATEVCDGLDNDCDGLVDDEDTNLDTSTQSTWYVDADSDGYGDPDTTTAACYAPTDYTDDDQDCDDTTADAHPAATEVCDDIDNDCDGLIDDEDDSVDLDSVRTFYVDADGDGYGDPEQTIESCSLTSGVSESGDDCDDADPEVHPGATELNGDDIDSDCDGEVDTKDADTIDSDGDGFSVAEGDCDDENAAINPMATDIVGDGYDQNCDGIDGTDSDGDGYASEASGGDDCDDTVSDAHPDGTEVIGDGIDNDCDGTTDMVSLDESDAIFIGNEASDFLGTGLGGGGDLNGDGYDDIVLGAHGVDDQGAAYVFFGPFGGEMSTTSADVVFTGNDGDSLGYDVRSGGDFDGDGYDDLLISAFSNDDYGYNTGAVYLMSGPLGSSTTLSNATALLYGTGDDEDGMLYYIGDPGDIDGDGYDDFLVAAPFTDATASTNNGRAYLVYGPVSGTDAIDNIADVTITGGVREYCCSALAADGDLDGDGYNELVLGTHYYQASSNTEVGAVAITYGPVTNSIDFDDADAWVEGNPAMETMMYSFYGQDTLSVSSDINGDGYDDLIVGHHYYVDTGHSQGAAYVFYGPIIGSTDVTAADAVLYGDGGDYAGVAVAGLEDTNGDGLGDILVAGMGASDSYSSSGTTFLIYGPVSGNIELRSEAAGAFTGTDLMQYSGMQLAEAGDVDGDGLTDMLIGAPFTNNYTGAAYLILGNSP